MSAVTVRQLESMLSQYDGDLEVWVRIYADDSRLMLAAEWSETGQEIDPNGKPVLMITGVKL